MIVILAFHAFCSSAADERKPPRRKGFQENPGYGVNKKDAPAPERAPPVPERPLTVFVSGPATVAVATHVAEQQRLARERAKHDQGKLLRKLQGARYDHTGNAYNNKWSVDSEIMMNGERYEAACFGQRVPVNVYKWFTNTPLGEFTSNLGLPVPSLGICAVKPKAITDHPIMKAFKQGQIAQDPASDLHKVLKNVADFMNAVVLFKEEREGSIPSASESEAMALAWSETVRGLQKKWYTEEQQRINLQPIRDDDTGVETPALMPAHVGMDEDSIEWCEKWTHDDYILQFFGATPENIKGLNQWVAETDATFLQKLSKFVPLVTVKGCFADVATFAHYVVGNYGTPVGRDENGCPKKILAGELGKALRRFAEEYLQPLNDAQMAFDRVEQEYKIMAASGNYGTPIDEEVMRTAATCANALKDVAERFPHCHFHDSEIDDIIVAAIIAYARQTLVRASIVRDNGYKADPCAIYAIDHYVSQTQDVKTSVVQLKLNSLGANSDRIAAAYKSMGVLVLDDENCGDFHNTMVEDVFRIGFAQQERRERERGPLEPPREAGGAADLAFFVSKTAAEDPAGGWFKITDPRALTALQAAFKDAMFVQGRESSMQGVQYVAAPIGYDIDYMVKWLENDVQGTGYYQVQVADPRKRRRLQIMLSGREVHLAAPLRVGDWVDNTHPSRRGGWIKAINDDGSFVLLREDNTTDTYLREYITPGIYGLK